MSTWRRSEKERQREKAVKARRRNANRRLGDSKGAEARGSVNTLRRERCEPLPLTFRRELNDQFEDPR